MTLNIPIGTKVSKPAPGAIAAWSAARANSTQPDEEEGPSRGTSLLERAVGERLEALGATRIEGSHPGRLFADLADELLEAASGRHRG